MVPIYFVQIAFQLTELFQIEINAVIYTDQFTCYNKKRPSKGWSGVHLLHDNASSHKCETVKSFLASEKVKVVNNPPYSPDLSPNLLVTIRNDQAKDGQESTFYMTTPPLISVRLLSLFWLLKR